MRADRLTLLLDDPIDIRVRPRCYDGAPATLTSDGISDRQTAGWPAEKKKGSSFLKERSKELLLMAADT